jgi:dTDP-4-dehydrorhamnose 3,5-epimerase
MRDSSGETMHFEALDVAGACLIRPAAAVDERGFFARTFCTQEFARHGLPERVVQSSISHNSRRGTVRGLHFQWPPSTEAKTVRCERGSILDVLLDLRPESPSYLRHQAVELNDSNRLAVHIPPGIAHGFQTLEDASEVLYMMSDYFAPPLADGVRWNDPAFGIHWPIAATNISNRDATYPDFDRGTFEARLAELRASG